MHQHYGTNAARGGVGLSRAAVQQIGARGLAIAFPGYLRTIDVVSAESPPRGAGTGRHASTGRPLRATSLLALGLLWAWSPGLAQEPVAAVWKEREVSFTYRSAIAVYSCNALRARVATILRAVGARPDVEVTLVNCDESMVVAPSSVADNRVGSSRSTYAASALLDDRQHEQSVSVRARLFMPAEITPDVMGELKADKSRRELITRVTGNPLPRFDDPVPFAALRRVVTLSHETIGLEPAECELLDQLSRIAFPALDVSVQDRDYSCDRRRVSRLRPTLVVEALVPATIDDLETEPPPAAGGEVDTEAPQGTGEARPPGAANQPLE